jgi:hypothetical protein
MTNLAFYSALKRNIQLFIPADKTGQVPVSQAQTWIAAKAREGKLFKLADVEWSGVMEWLSLQTGRIAVTDIVSFVDRHGVEVVDSVTTGEMTTYADYVVPGGDNYRALLLTLASKPRDTSGWTAVLYREHSYTVRDEKGVEIGNFPGHDNPQSAIAHAAQHDQQAPERRIGREYKSNHWKDPNVIAHIRFDDRQDSNGDKILMIHEIQSDWAQEGRRRGVGTSRASIETLPEGGFTLRFKSGAKMGEYATQEAAEDGANRIGDIGVVPGPFIGSTGAWATLAIKRMVHYAATNGYQRVALISGEQAANLYRLDKNIQAIEYKIDEGAALGDLEAFDCQGERVMSHCVGPLDLPKYIGKEIAQKLMQSRGPGYMNDRRAVYVLDDENLHITNHGMRGFYDDILPKVAADVLKKLGGGPLEQFVVHLDSAGATATQRGFAITDAMREAVKEGIPLFSRMTEVEKMAADYQPVDLYHVTSLKNLMAIARDGLRAHSYWSADTDVSAYYMETVADEGETPVTLVINQRQLASHALAPDMPGIEEPITSALGKSESDIHDGEPGAMRSRRAQAAIKTERFQSWFAGSKAVALDGQPQVLYHGSKSPWISQFDLAMEGTGVVSGLGGTKKERALWFSSSRLAADYFADRHPKRTADADHSMVYGGDGAYYGSVADGDDNALFQIGPYLSESVADARLSENIAAYNRQLRQDTFVTPAFLNLQNPLILEGVVPRAEQFAAARAGGHDGIIAKDVVDGHYPSDVYVVFDPSQVKAVDNNGDFDPDTPEIRYDRGPGQPVIYSAVQRAFEQARQAGMPATQWSSWLRANAAKLGIKAEEIQWSGITEFPPADTADTVLAGASVKRTLAMLADFFRVDVGVLRLAKGAALHFNGAAFDDTLWLNEASRRPLHTVLGHELLHQMRRDRPDLYDGLYQELLPLLKNQDAFARNARIADRSTDYIHEEMVADVFGERFGEPQFWQAVAEKNPTLFEKISTYMSETLHKVVSYLRDNGGDSAFVSDIAAARQAVVSTVDDYARHLHQPREEVDDTWHDGDAEDAAPAFTT